MKREIITFKLLGMITTGLGMGLFLLSSNPTEMFPEPPAGILLLSFLYSFLGIPLGAVLWFLWCMIRIAAGWKR